MKRACLLACGLLAMAASSLSANSSAGLSEEQAGKARALFEQYNCAACHAFADAGANGGMGPALDSPSSLSETAIAAQLRDGGDEMPAYGGAMSDEQIGLMAAYIVQFRK